MEILARKSIMVAVTVETMMVMMMITMMSLMMATREMRVACSGEGNFLKRYKIYYRQICVAIVFYGLIFSTNFIFALAF